MLLPVAIEPVRPRSNIFLVVGDGLGAVMDEVRDALWRSLDRASRHNGQIQGVVG